MDPRPFVSICTVTYQRPGPLKLLERRIEEQTYPLKKIQWVIFYDSPEPHEYYSKVDTIKSRLQIKYNHLSDKLPLGKKRNISHSYCEGEVIVYMDDDDFYPPSRVEHAVESLSRSGKEVAGSSAIPILFINNVELWMAGPYAENHATANTFAFKRSLLEKNSYKDEDTCSEEKAFLKNYTVPMVQLEPFQTVVCISHGSNTYDKSQMLPNPGANYNPETRMRKLSNLSESQVKSLEMIAQEHLTAGLTFPEQRGSDLKT